MKARWVSLIPTGFFCVCAGLFADSPPSNPTKAEEPEIEIVHRTLAQAPDGTPDNRSAVGIGEWLEFRALPETENRVEWITTGDVTVTNRFGNATIMIVGSSPGGLSVSAKVHDTPPITPPEAKAETDAQGSNAGSALQNAVKELEELVETLPGFETHCGKVVSQLQPFSNGLRQISLPDFSALLGKLDAWAPKVPGSRNWAKFQRLMMEAAIYRMALHLDDTRDDVALEKEYWAFLHACIASVSRLQADFEAAGGHGNSLSGPASASLPVAERRRKEMANTLSISFPDLWDFLRVQIRNALPGKPAAEHRDALKERGFSEEELGAVFGNG